MMRQRREQFARRVRVFRETCSLLQVELANLDASETDNPLIAAYEDYFLSL